MYNTDTALWWHNAHLTWYRGQTQFSKYLLFWNICEHSVERKIYVTYNTVTTAHFCNYYYWRGLDCRVTLCCPDFWWFSHNFSSVVLALFCSKYWWIPPLNFLHIISFHYLTYIQYIFSTFQIFSPAILTWWWWGCGRRSPSAPWRRLCSNTRLPTRRPSRSVYHIYKYL